YGPGEATVLAFLAGADLLLMPADAGQAIDAMEAAALGGRISRERLDASVRRVLDWKKRLGLFENRFVNLDSVMATVGRGEFQELARDIAERSIVLAVDDGTADSLRAAPRRLALVSYADGARETVGTTFASELRARGHTVSTIRLHAESGPAAFDSARALIDRSPMTVFAVSVRPVDSKGSIALPPEVNALIDSTACRKPMRLASLRSPY